MYLIKIMLAVSRSTSTSISTLGLVCNSLGFSSFIFCYTQLNIKVPLSLNKGFTYQVQFWQLNSKILCTRN